jgi:hypothetical protein
MSSRRLRFTTFQVGPAEAIPPDRKSNNFIIFALRAPASDAGIAPQKKNVRNFLLMTPVGAAASCANTRRSHHWIDEFYTWTDTSSLPWPANSFGSKIFFHISAYRCSGFSVLASLACTLTLLASDVVHFALRFKTHRKVPKKCIL